MPLLMSAQVIINTRTLRIDGQTYSLANLARVQIVKLPKPRGADKGNTVLAALGCFGLYLFAFPIAVWAGLGWISIVVVFLAVGLANLINQKTKKPYTPHYALMLETTGKPRATLISTDKAELERVSVHITNAMDNPPETEQVYTVHNVISGDQYNLVGDHNIGKVGSVD